MKEFLIKKVMAPGAAEWALASGLLVIRFGFGFMMLFGHGWVKWVNFSLMSATFPDPLGVGNATSLLLAIFAEVVCALLVMSGLLTRIALLPLIFTMLIAFFGIHGADPFATRELSMVYLLVFSTLLLTGPGKYSADYYLLRRLNLK